MYSAAVAGLHFRGVLVILALTTVIVLLYFGSIFSDVFFDSNREYVTDAHNMEIISEKDSKHGYRVRFPENTHKHEKSEGISYNFGDGNENKTDSLTTEAKELQESKDKSIKEAKGEFDWKHKSPYIDKKFHLNITGEPKTKTILWWNPPGWLQNWYTDFDMNQCEYKNCRVSFDRRLFQDSNAVVYSIADEGMGYKPPVERNRRDPNQAWLFFTLESPVHVKINGRPFMNQHWNDVFNWSWTYRADADIFHPYGTLVTKEIVPKKNYSEIFRQKTKLAAWAVSHCSTYSEREKYESLLNKYAKVDIYGACGMKPPQNLKKLISENYKFYLGFENSLCDWYVTEKFFYYYKMDVITIVRGRVDYNKYLPRGSFINTADFPSVKALADFMHDLGSNEEKYIKYLKVKDSYKVYERDFMYRDASCDLCERLNHLEKYRKSYKSASDWLGSCYAVNDLKESK